MMIRESILTGEYLVAVGEQQRKHRGRHPVLPGAIVPTAGLSAGEQVRQSESMDYLFPDRPGPLGKGFHIPGRVRIEVVAVFVAVLFHGVSVAPSGVLGQR